MREMAVDYPTERADRYVALWNEADPRRRRATVADAQTIEKLWTTDCVHILELPHDVVVRFNWETFSADGEVTGVGLGIFRLAPMAS